KTKDLGEYVGKGAAEIWLSEDLDEDLNEYNDLIRTFILTLKYYLRREGHGKSKADDIRELIVTQFTGIYKWVGKTRFAGKEMNLGVAFFALHRWDECISFFKIVAERGDHPRRLWLILANVYAKKGDLDGMLKMYGRATEKNPYDFMAWRYLGD